MLEFKWKLHSAVAHWAMAVRGGKILRMIKPRNQSYIMELSTAHCFPTSLVCGLFLPNSVKTCEQTVHLFMCLFSQHSRHQNCIWANVKNQQYLNCWEYRHWHCNLGWLSDIFRQCGSSSCHTNMMIQDRMSMTGYGLFIGLRDYSLCCLSWSQRWGFWRVAGSPHTGQLSASWPLLPQSCKQGRDRWREEEREGIQSILKVCVMSHKLDIVGLFVTRAETHRKSNNAIL